MAKNIKKRSASHIYFGVNKLTGELKHISEVPSGQKCNCICAACLQPFEARKGTRRRHHFAHVSNYECMYASEVAIYKAFVEALKQSGFLTLPPVMLRFPAWHDPELLQEARRLKIDSVAFECEPLSYPPLLRMTMQGTPLRILLDFDRYYDDDDRRTNEEEIRLREERDRSFERRSVYPRPTPYAARPVVPAGPTQEELDAEYIRICQSYDPTSDEWTVDRYNRRWIMCTVCGRIKQDAQMSYYGGKGGANRGVCTDCSRNGRS